MILKKNKQGSIVYAEFVEESTKGETSDKIISYHKGEITKIVDDSVDVRFEDGQTETYKGKLIIMTS